MLMDAPPQESVRPAVQVLGNLLELGLSAPQIMARDVAEAGFLLLEDFGDDTYTRLLKNGADELELYQLATDTGDRVAPPLFGEDSAIPLYDDGRFLDEAALLVDWYLPAIRGRDTPAATEIPICSSWQDVLQTARDVPDSLILRDYHVDNLNTLSIVTASLLAGSWIPRRRYWARYIRSRVPVRRCPTRRLCRIGNDTDRPIFGRVSRNRPTSL